MVRVCTAAVVAAAGFLASAGGQPPPAEKAKETKLTGTLVCGACALNASKTCANVLEVKGAADKDVVRYWLVDKGSREGFHHEVCGGGKLEGVTVYGVVGEKDGKKTVTPTRVEVTKKE